MLSWIALYVTSAFAQQDRTVLSSAKLLLTSKSSWKTHLIAAQGFILAGHVLLRASSGALAWQLWRHGSVKQATLGFYLFFYNFVYSFLKKTGQALKPPKHLFSSALNWLLFYLSLNTASFFIKILSKYQTRCKSIKAVKR